MEQLSKLIKTTVYKDNIWKTWKAESRLDLGGSRNLKFHTSKVHSGKLVTTASVCKIDGVFESHMVYQDLYVTLASNKVRVTEKACREQHSSVVFDDKALADLVERVRLQYFQNLSAGQFAAQILESNTTPKSA